ncbi:MAG: GDSL-type esterase/lipase family protein [Eubacteriales bacterium]|nr:GDSL-type esterase/lipase family protein [Eubacteriales bacterium]
MNKNIFRKSKILSAAVLMLSLAISLAAPAFAAQDIVIQDGQTTDGLNYVDVSATPGNVKVIGRADYSGNMLVMAGSGSGCEFSFYGDQLTLTFAGDTSAVSGNTKLYPRIAIYVNGERTHDFMIDSPEKTVNVVNASTPAVYTVKVLKLSEAQMSIAGIKNISVHSINNVVPTPDKNMLIEFVGDSLSCGYGVDDTAAGNVFYTSTEDVTKSYAYKTAELLGADYSIVAFSGYGVLPGTSMLLDGDFIAPKSMLQYYERLSYSRGHIGTNVYAEAIDWDFSRQPDVIVVNLGTNDYEYIRTGADSIQDFKDYYREMLDRIMNNNPDSKILCTLGIMGQELCPQVEEVVNEINAGPGSRDIYTMRFDVMQASDGLVTNGHPGEATYTKNAEQLTAKIREIMGM